MIPLRDLRKINLLAALTDEELQQLSQVMHIRKERKGATILHADDPAPSMMFLAKGAVKISLTSNEGKEIVLANIGEGDFFGEIALLTGGDRSANVTCLEDCRLYVLLSEDFQRHILTHIGLSLAMMKELALRLRSASEKIGDLALFDVYRRVARTLKSLGVPQGSAPNSFYLIEKRPTHQELASIVGTSREMISRALKGLEEDGCVVVVGKSIELHRMPL